MPNRTVEALHVSRLEAQERLNHWTRAYTPLKGIPDEFMGQDQEPCAHWTRFLQTLAYFELSEINHRFSAADRRIRDMGMSYRIYGESHERIWPLSGLPLLISESEWETISKGLIQRAELIEHILHDIYGSTQLVEGGMIPATLITGSPDYLRPIHGIRPMGGRFMPLYAADIGRGPDGRWWVLSDHTQIPVGLGYALENRMVLARAFPNFYKEMHVKSLAGFFRDFRTSFTHMASRATPRICLLTQGPQSETYFEQANLARYLGFLLTEGEDLVLSDGKILVRTIAGLKRADVIWPHMRGDLNDPLELDIRSTAGVPGLLESIREGQVAVANMPGAGLAESTAFLSFLPHLAQHILREDLLLPNIATWWCGQPRESQHVLDHMEHLAIRGAFSSSLPGFPNQTQWVGSDLTQRQKEALQRRIQDRGVDYVGQEIVQLSTTPVWENGELRPRPFILRVYAAATQSGWQIFPGGFCRISAHLDARAVSMAAGAQSADVWIISETPQEAPALLVQPQDTKIIRLMGNLPSRAADNLFWYGRYLERTEATLRLIRCLCNRMMDSFATDASAAQTTQPIYQLQALLADWGAIPEDIEAHTPLELALLALQDAHNYGSALSVALSAKRAASIIRERLSQDSWLLMNQLCARMAEELHSPSELDILERIDRVMKITAALSGLISENVNRVAGWNFLEIGRRVERAMNTCRFARQFADNKASIEGLDVLLDLIDSQITYRSRYLFGLALTPVRDMVLLDPFNPRSVAFQIQQIGEHLLHLPSLHEDGMLEPPRRLSIRLNADFSVERAEDIDHAKILQFENRLAGLSNAIAMRYFLQRRHTSPLSQPAMSFP